MHTAEQHHSADYDLAQRRRLPMGQLCRDIVAYPFVLIRKSVLNYPVKSFICGVLFCFFVVVYVLGKMLEVRARSAEMMKINWVFLLRTQAVLFELLLRFVTVLVPACLHFGTKTNPKSRSAF